MNEKQEREYLSPLGNKYIGPVIDWSLCKPIGMHIYNIELWKDLKSFLKHYGIQINPYGSEHIIKHYSKFATVFFPRAGELGLNPMVYMTEQTDKILEIISNTNIDRWVEQNKKLQTDIIKDTDKKILGKIKTVFAH